MIRILCFILLGLFTLSAEAREPLNVDIASDHVDITTGFDGSDIVLFGVKNGVGDLAVSIKGPLKTMVVRKKNSVLGAWMNTESVTFENVPGFYSFALSAELSEYDAEFLKKYSIGVENLDFNTLDGDVSKDLKKEFLTSLKRNKQAQNLFATQPIDIQMIGEHLFKLSLYIPSNVPVGQYEIKTLLVNGKRVREEKVTSMTVEQVGRNAQIYGFAIHSSFYYGLLCVFMAVFAGWLINVIRGN